MPMIATQAALSAQPDGHAYDCHTVGPARWAYLRLPHRLHSRPSQMGMLTIATRLVQPDVHAYDCHTGYIVGLAQWACLRLLHGRSSQMGICLQLSHRLHCRSSQMGMLTIATQATLSVQPDGHAYDCHSGYNFGSARSVGRFSQTGTLTIAARAGQSSQTGVLTIAARAGQSSQMGILTIATRAG